MGFSAAAIEITKWVGVGVGTIATGLALGYGAKRLKKWLDKKFYKPYQPRPHITRVKLPRREP